MTKKHVDNYLPGKRIPNCQLSADLEDDSTEVKVVPFRYRIKLLGAKEPYNKFTIKPPASSIRHDVAHHSSPSSAFQTTKRSLTPFPTAGIQLPHVHESCTLRTYAYVHVHAGSSLKKIRTTEPQIYSGKINFLFGRKRKNPLRLQLYPFISLLN